MNLRKASSSDRSLSTLSLANVSRTSKSCGILDKALWSHSRTIPGHGGLGGTRPTTSTEGEREGAAELTVERGSLGVGGKAEPGRDDRVWTRFGEGRSSKGRDLLDDFLDGMLGRKVLDTLRWRGDYGKRKWSGDVEEGDWTSMCGDTCAGSCSVGSSTKTSGTGTHQ